MPVDDRADRSPRPTRKTRRAPAQALQPGCAEAPVDVLVTPGRRALGASQRRSAGPVVRGRPIRRSPPGRGPPAATRSPESAARQGERVLDAVQDAESSRPGRSSVPEQPILEGHRAPAILDGWRRAGPWIARNPFSTVQLDTPARPHPTAGTVFVCRWPRPGGRRGTRRGRRRSRRRLPTSSHALLVETVRQSGGAGNGGRARRPVCTGRRRG